VQKNAHAPQDGQTAAAARQGREKNIGFHGVLF
jgi:hypothetical protein